MTLVSSASAARRGRVKPSHRMPLVVGVVIGALAIAAVSYLLWPTWRPMAAGGPDRTPVSIGDTLFNVPTKSFRVKYQAHSGPQERIDLAFVYPSLAPPERLRHVTAEEIDSFQPIDRIFVSIAAHHDAMAPEIRLRTIYPRYLESQPGAVEDGLSVRPFRDGSPYAGEDLVMAESPAFAARCSRDKRTPGMCTAERRIEGADLSFRFPRAWLTGWRDVAASLDRLTAQMHAAHAPS